jgi:uncharacterized protein (TIGR02145 family)
MKKYIYILWMIAMASSLRAQFAAVFTKDSFTRLENDSVIMTPAEGLRGAFQWQKSIDSINWTNIEANLTDARFAFIPEVTEVYRLQITEGTCLPLYSDSVKVFSKHTTVSEYLSAGISSSHLFTAGVPISDLLATGLSVLDLFNAGIMVGILEQNGIDSLTLVDAGLIGVLYDFDNNKYKWIKINDQVWMAENLKTTHYSNGTAIPLVKDETDWQNLGYSDEAYCYYDNSSDNGKKYGALYTWSASMKVCPSGWHLPNEAEWTKLTNYLGGLSVAGGKMKEIGTAHWPTPNTGATNESGFTALPGGYRGRLGMFSRLGNYGQLWGATEYSSSHAWFRYLYFGNRVVYLTYYTKSNGFSVRCIKD